MNKQLADIHEVLLEIRDLLKTAGSGRAAIVKPTPSRTSKKPAVDPKKVAAFIAVYCEAYKKRYGSKTRPACLDDGKTIGEITRFLENRSFELASSLIQVYLQMGDKWFCENKGHDFTTFAQNITKIQTALHTGKENPAKESFLDFMKKQGAVGDTRALQQPNRKA